MNSTFLMLTAILVSFFVSGCSNLRELTAPKEKNLLSGAGSVFVKNEKSEEFEQIDIDKLLKSYGLDPLHWEASALSKAPEDVKYRYLRNDLQDRIIAASNLRCGTYLRELVTSKSQTQMGWGSLALLLSGAASVTTPASAARILAAGSAVSTGVNGIYNEAYFNNLAVNVILAGITKQREGIIVQLSALQKKSLVDYTVNRAIADALIYHSACNIVSGLETAAAATKLAPDVAPAGAAKTVTPQVSQRLQ